jgi:hypothetical protein
MDAVVELHLPFLQPLSRTAPRPKEFAEREPSLGRPSNEALDPSLLISGIYSPDKKNIAKTPAKALVKPRNPLTPFHSVI